MDKIKLTKEDVDKLFAWRDEHKDLVRIAPPALNAIEIQFGKLSWKAIAKGDMVTFHVYDDGKKMGKLEFERMFLFMSLKKNKSKLPSDVVQSLLTAYCSLMAYMTYAHENVDRVPRKDKHSSVGIVRKPSISYTYILHHKSENKPAGGHHRSPQGIFSVRGHFRQYKSGKRVWIEPYQKGTGNKKDKEYKM